MCIYFGYSDTFSSRVVSLLLKLTTDVLEGRHKPPPSPPHPAGRGGCTPTPVYKSPCVSLKTTDEGGVRGTPLALGSPEAPGGLPEAFTGALGPPAFPEGYQGG